MGWVTVQQLLCRGSYARPAPTSCVTPMLGVILTTGRISTTAYCEHTIQARLTKNVRMSLSIQKVCASLSGALVLCTHTNVVTSVDCR